MRIASLLQVDILVMNVLKLSPLGPVIKIPVQQRILEKYGKDITICPCSKVGKLEIVETKRFGIKPKDNESLNRFKKYKNKEPTLKKE